MGGKQKVAEQQRRANAIAQASMRKQAQQAQTQRRAALRSSQADRRAGAKQNAALVKAERQSAALLAQIGAGADAEANLRTDVIQDEEAARRKLLAGGSRSAYGFARPTGVGLGGGNSILG